MDEVITRRRGQYYQQALNRLRDTFPFRKWQNGQDSFCGSQLQQCPETFEIKVSQEEFVDKMQKPKLHMKEDANFEVNEHFKVIFGRSIVVSKGDEAGWGDSFFAGSINYVETNLGSSERGGQQY